MLLEEEKLVPEEGLVQVSQWYGLHDVPHVLGLPASHCIQHLLREKLGVTRNNENQKLEVIALLVVPKL